MRTRVRTLVWLRARLPGEPVLDLTGDGLVVASPTGSEAGGTRDSHLERYCFRVRVSRKPGWGVFESVKQA
jgi:hypothetical protein